MTLKVTILGCGSSAGVPRPGVGWGACDPSEPRNRRLRCSILIERTGPEGTTKVIVDTTPDLREQLLSADITHLDGVLFSHDHADHTHGIDDLRGLVLHMRRRISVHADDVTRNSLTSRFGYLFTMPEGSMYPPILDMHPLAAGREVTVAGPGGDITALPFECEHGPGYQALGFRFGDLGYLPDVSAIPPESMAAMAGLDILILDCLREAPHISHFHLAQSLETIAELKPRRAVLTNLHSDLDYNRLAGMLPANVVPGYDGMVVTDER